MKKKKPTQAAKLPLKTETIRRLTPIDPTDLAKVAGGGGWRTRTHVC